MFDSMTPTPSRPEEPIFKPELYEGTAADYDRYRLPYADALIEFVRHELALDGTGTLVDLGTGTGQVARGLRPFFAQVLGVDPEPDMIEYGRSRSEREDDGIDWRLARAEDVDFPLASVDVVASGNAFHRFDRPAVVKKVTPWLTPDGAIVLFWSDSVLSGDQPWKRELSQVVDDWLVRSGADARIPAGWERKEYPDEVVLREAGFERLLQHNATVRHQWTVDSIVGFLHATSFASRAALGAHLETFDADVRDALLGANRGGLYDQEVRFGTLIARL
jgi:SAM-dependent methyltransferase